MAANLKDLKKIRKDCRMRVVLKAFQQPKKPICTLEKREMAFAVGTEFTYHEPIALQDHDFLISIL